MVTTTITLDTTIPTTGAVAAAPWLYRPVWCDRALIVDPITRMWIECYISGAVEGPTIKVGAEGVGERVH